MDSGAIGVFLIATLIVGGMLFAVILLTRKQSRLNVQKYQSRWLQIEAGLKKNEPSSYAMAILNADKLVGLALEEKGFSGKTMGERMKAAQSTWTNADHIWGAHKVRNKIAHEPDVFINYEIAARSLAAFKQALRDLEAI